MNDMILIFAKTAQQYQKSIIEVNRLERSNPKYDNAYIKMNALYNKLNNYHKKYPDLIHNKDLHKRLEGYDNKEKELLEKIKNDKERFIEEHIYAISRLTYLDYIYSISK